MASESTRTAENEALGKTIAGIEAEVATVKVVVRRASRTRLALLVVALTIICTAIWAFWSLGKGFGSEENLNLLAEKAQARIDEGSGQRALEQVEKLQKNALPVLQKAFTDQVEKDKDTYSDKIDEERQKLQKNLETKLNEKIQAHFEKASEKYQAILKDEFPELEDPELLDAVYSSVVDIMDRLVEEYYSEKVRSEIQGLNDKWADFEMAELPSGDDEPLEKQFLAALLHLAAMKIDDASVE